MNKKDMAFFNAAKAVSNMSDYNRVHVGCVITNGHHIISSGFNTTKSHPLQKRMNIKRFSADTVHSLHAEISALSHIMNKKDIDWKNCSIYVYRELKNGDKAIAKPCKSCEALIKSLGIRKIYYTTYNGFAEERWQNNE